MNPNLRNICKEKMLVDILIEKHRRTFIVKDFMDRIIEINAALKEFTEEVLRYQDYGEDDFYEKINDLDARLNGLKEQTDYLMSDDNIKDVNQRADTYISKMVTQLKARVIAEQNQKGDFRTLSQV